MFNFFQQSAFGLDLSDLSLKIIKLKKKGGEIALTSFCRKEIPRGIIEKGRIKKEEELIRIINEAMADVKGEPLKTKLCIVSVPEIEAFIRIIQLPLMKKEELEEAIQWEAEANIPMPLNEIYLDWQIIAKRKPFESKSNDHQNILIGALSKKLVDDYLEIIKRAGLIPLSFEIESIATTRALIKNEFIQKPVIIVDLGAERTSFIIFSDSAVCFTSNLPIGNNKLVEMIAKTLNISQEKARCLKFEIGLDRTKKGEEVFSALVPSMTELTEKIKECVNFYQDHPLPDFFPAGQIAEIILCGGGANLIGLDNFIFSETKIKTRIGNPWINILAPDFKKIPELPYKESITYTTALGLALRGLTDQF